MNSEAGNNDFDNIWDDTLLIKAYNDSVKMAKEELARRLAHSTNKQKDCSIDLKNTSHDMEDCYDQGFKVGDYVRATYEDGVDYEAKILSINHDNSSCILKYIGYDNEQEVNLNNLIVSWGKKSRRAQFIKAKKALESNDVAKKGKTNIFPKDLPFSEYPPIPPMPPMMSAPQNVEGSEHLSAMLMAWYMSGYYTGIYEGLQMAKKKSKNKKLA